MFLTVKRFFRDPSFFSINVFLVSMPFQCPRFFSGRSFFNVYVVSVSRFFQCPHFLKVHILCMYLGFRSMCAKH